MDTIAAISTGNTLSAIGILRVSGEGSFAICGKVFRAANGRPLEEQTPREMVLGRLLDREGRAVDACLAVRFPGPRSYTGEDSVEFHCHGSPVVLEEGLRALFAAGARQAERGEFTKRAFLSGNIDLTQAEAVIDLIEAETAGAARNAVEQLDGSLRRRIEGVYGELLNIASQFYAVVDYPDEDIEDLRLGDITGCLEKSVRALEALLATFDRGQVLRQGVPTAILGRPNVGKSSLLNALVGYERAIVTDVAGTTRDTVEEKAVVGGVLLRLIDTAGIRDAADAVERLGVDRARQAMERAALILLVEDGGGMDQDLLEAVAGSGKPWVCIASKRDLPGRAQAGPPEGPFCPDAFVSLSTLTGEGLEELEKTVARLFPSGDAPSGQILTNPRQAGAVTRASQALRRAREALDAGLTPDAVLTDVESALSALGELTGRTLREDRVPNIFDRFCVGK